MDSKFIKSTVFNADPNSKQASKEWRHCCCTFSNFVDSFSAGPALSNEDKSKCLIAHISKDVYDYVSECLTYQEAIQTLERLYVKPCNIIFVRHLLMPCKQQQAQSLDDYLQKLKQLAKDCNYRSVSADVSRNEAIRNAFISGLLSTSIRSRLLENTRDKSMTLKAIFNEARCFDTAQKSSESYTATDGKAIEVIPVSSIKSCEMRLAKVEPFCSEKLRDACVIRQQMKKCERCGANQLHKKFQCPAQRSKCFKCGSYGHFARQCCSRFKRSNCSIVSNDNDVIVINDTAGVPDIVNVHILVNNVAANAIIDTGSTLSYVNQKYAIANRFQLSNESNEIGLAVTGNCFQSKEVCLSSIRLQNRTYYDVKLHVLKDLLTDVIVGQDILRLHDYLRFNFGGPRPSLCINALKCIKTNVVPRLFEHLASDCKPIITKSRKHFLANEKLIAETIKKRLEGRNYKTKLFSLVRTSSCRDWRQS